MKKQIILYGLLIMLSYKAKAQEHHFEKAYTILQQMLVDSTQYSFKKAVMTVENAYHYGTLDTIGFQQEIGFLAELSRQISSTRKLKSYNYSDVKEVLKYASLYSVMQDSIPIHVGKEVYTTVPYQYDFDDIWGTDDWSKMFVSKLLNTGNGNCHSLPYLYKILAEEIGVEAYLALAPNHVYIKQKSEKDGWYNTELTSGVFPVDAWIMASGYVHLDGIRNGLYMKALNKQESIALTLVDLAQGYEKRFPTNDGTFVLKCAQTALLYFPNLITARLLQLENLKKQLVYKAERKRKDLNTYIQSDSKAQEVWRIIGRQLEVIHRLGYRQMPKEMYVDWLISLKEEKDKYVNKSVQQIEK